MTSTAAAGESGATPSKKAPAKDPGDLPDVSDLVVGVLLGTGDGSYRFEGGPEVAAGLRLLDQSGEGFDSKSQIPRGWVHVRYRVLIRLRGEPGPSRYLDAYPQTQRGVPGVEPGWTDSHADLGMYGSEAFVRWLEALVGRATPAESGAAADRGGT